MSNLSTFRLSPALFNANLLSRVSSIWFADLPTTATRPRPEDKQRWYGIGATSEERKAFDAEIRSTFGPVLNSIAPDTLHLPPFKSFATDRHNAALLSAPFRRLEALRTPAEPARSANGVALILLLDQMPRHVFRDAQGPIYAHFDRLARALVYSMTQPPDTAAAGQGDQDADLADLRGMHISPSLRRAPTRLPWLVLPLMHSEDLADHDLWAAEYGRFIINLQVTDDVAGAEYLQEDVAFEKEHREILERFGRYPHRNECLGREHKPEEKEYLDGGGQTFTANA